MNDVVWVVSMFFAGLFLSAFFSGSETGFYRVTRVRLVLDGRGGDLTSRALLWLTNNPALFVATTLIGNNIANYLASRALVLGVHLWPMKNIEVAELAAPLVLSPLVFVYGELLPKHLYFHAPNLLLRRSGPLFLLFTFLILPVSLVLWSLGRVLQSILGETPLRVRLTLARKELRQMLQEGQEAGILKPAQRRLAHNLFAVASMPVVDFSTPVTRVTSVSRGSRKSDVLRLARRQRVAVVPINEQKSREIIGYVRVVDLHLDPSKTVDVVRPFMTVNQQESHVSTLIRMQSQREEVARVVDADDQMIGLVYARQLTEPLFRGE